MKTKTIIKLKSNLLPRLGVALLLPLLFAMAATNALASLLAYEPYNYPLNTTPTAASGTPTQTTGGGFTGPYNGNGGVWTAVAGLTYPSLLTSANCLNTTGGYIGENLATPVSGGPTYISFLIKLPASPAAALTGLELNTGGNGIFVGITATSTASTGFLGVNTQAGYNDGAGNLWQSPTANITYGNTYFVVVKLDGVGGGKIWVNPTAATATEPAATGTFSKSAFTISACTEVNPGGGNFNFDELRIANTWADAVSYVAPTPATVSITSPVGGATVGTNYSINASATISPGTIANVSFFDNGSLLGSAASAPYTYSVVGAAAGAHALKAVAQDSGGNFTTSSVVNITVGIPNRVLFQNGDFDHPSGSAAGCDGLGNFWATNSFAAPFTFSFPTSGGNPGGYAVMDDTAGGLYGVLVGGNVTPVPLATMALVAGQTYTFVQDMIIPPFGGNPGGLKIESWGPNGKISDSGNMYPALIGDGTTWKTYSFSYTIDPAATGIKLVPLWSPGFAVGYDNIGVLVPATALSVSIASPTNNATVNTNFTVTAVPVVSPAVVTNVYFYVDGGLVGSNPSYPYTYTSGNAALTGAHALQVIAKANNGSSSTSSVVNVTIVPAAQPIPNYPITDAPTPTRQPSSVLSLLNSSGIYPNQPVSTWATPWSVASGMGVNYTNTVTGRVVKAYPLLQYAGIDFPALNLSAYTAMHVDVWSPNATQFSVQLAGKNVSYKDLLSPVQLTNKGWISLDFPLTAFPSLNPASVAEFLFVDNDPAVENATFYIDNVYFWTTNQVNAGIALGTQVNWANAGGYNYQPQKSADNSTWLNLGSLVTANIISNAFDPAPVAFYRVQQTSQSIVSNGGFETAGPAGWASISSGSATYTRTTNAAHLGTWGMDFNVTGAPSQAGLQEGFLPITPGASYYFSAWSKLIQTSTSFSTFCLIQWFDAGNNYVSQNQVNLTPASGTWTQNSGSFTAPSNATQAQIQVIANTGAVTGNTGEVYIDDVALYAGGAPTTNNIAYTIQSAAGVIWKSVAGNDYTVQSSPSLTPTVWSPVGANVTGTGTNTVSDPLRSNGMFYRVLENY